MRRLELTATRQNNVEVVSYDLDVGDVYDERVAEKVPQLVNIIPFRYSDEDGKRTITSYIHEDTNLETMIKKTLSKREVLCIMSGLASALEIGTQGIPVSYLVKDLNYIYININTLSVKCILVPVKQDVMPLAEIPALFRTVISKMKFSDEDKDNYVANLLTLINSDDFSISKYKVLVDEQLEKMGLFISKENGVVDIAENTAGGVQNNSVKVNRLGVMNNMQNAVRLQQSQMQMNQQMMNYPNYQPQYGQPSPQMGTPMMQQPSQMGAPMVPQQPQMRPPMMPQQQQPVMPKAQPTPQPVQSATPMMPQQQQPVMPKAQPTPQPVQSATPMMPQAPQPVMPKAQPTPQPVQPAAPMMPQAPQPVMPKAQPTPQPVQPAAPMMPQAPQPVMPKAQPTPQPVQPAQPKMPPMPQPQSVMPKVQPMPQQQQPGAPIMPQSVQPQPIMPKMQPTSQNSKAMATANIIINSVKPVDDETTDMLVKSDLIVTQGSMTQGSLVGQLGTRPIPHIVRKSTGEVINISKPQFLIGKSKTKADYAIENNAAISRVHCIIVQRDGVNYIKDNNSTNHTYINGVELQPGKEVLLKNKTVIQLGDEEFTFLLRKGE